MLGIFQKAFAHPPEELHSPVSSQKAKLPQEALLDFLSSHPPESTLSLNFADSAVLAYSTPSPPDPLQKLLFVGYEDVYCLFKGSLNNLCPLIRQYGLSPKSTNEAMLVVEAYRTLRDRGPYPSDQVMKDLDGSFAFIMYDSTTATLFTAMSSDGAVKLYWGLAADGSAIISDEIEFAKRVCGKSFGPFPNGCMFHSEGGLMSYEHPMYKMRAMPRVDSEGAMCGAYFKVDVYTRINSMPRVGSSSNWTEWDSRS